MIVPNTGNYPLDLTFPTPVLQMIGSNASIDLVDDQLGGYFWCICGSFEQVLDYRTIQPGSSTNISTSYIYIYEYGLTTLPDGEYLFSYYLWSQAATLFTANQVLVTIASGVPTIDYDYTIRAEVSLQYLIPIVSAAFLVIILSVKRQKKICNH